MLRTFPFVLFSIAALAGDGSAASLRVPLDLSTIQAGIDAAGPGDTVVIDCGIYEELGLAMKAGVVLTSATGQFDCVTIRGNLDQLDNPPHGMICVGLDASTVIQGLTIDGDRLSYERKRGILCDSSDVVIRNCRITRWNSNGPGIEITNGSPLIEGCTIDQNGAEEHGGGIRSFNASPTIRGCLVEDNSAALDEARGGGIWCGGTTSAIIEDCVILGNRSLASNGPAAAYGGGVALTDRAVIRRCTISENGSEQGGGIRAIGSVTITGCTIESNSARFGGGVVIDAGSVRIENCTIAGNSGRNGSGVAVIGATATLAGCRITGNSGNFGGGLHTLTASVSISACTIANNHGDTTGGVHSTASTLDVENSILLNECGIIDVRLLSGSTLSVGCSDIDDGPRLRVVSSAVHWLGGTFFADPLFCDAIPCGAASGAGDYRLESDSPCLPENNACAASVGSLGEGCEAISVNATSWTRIKERYR